MGCEGQPVDYSDIMPEELQKIRKQLAEYTSARVGQPATGLPEGFPLSAGTNMLQQNAAQLMNQIMGGGQFGMAPYRTLTGTAGSGGGIDKSKNVLRTSQGNVNLRNFPPGHNPQDPSTWWGYDEEGKYAWRPTFEGEESAPSASGRGVDVWVNTPYGRFDPRRMPMLGNTTGEAGGGVSPRFPSTGGGTSAANDAFMRLLLQRGAQR